jgi:hypothetical protein
MHRVYGLVSLGLSDVFHLDSITTLPFLSLLSEPQDQV